MLKTEEEKLNSISNQLKLAIHWGCYDNVEFLLKKFDEDLKKKKSDEKNVWLFYTFSNFFFLKASISLSLF